MHKISHITLKRKLPAVLALVVFLFLLLVCRLFYIQIIDGTGLQTLALDQWTRDLPFRAERGDIVILDTTDNPGYTGNGGSVFSGQTIVKRLIAVEGDSVKCEGGVVYLREAGGEYRALDEPYACNMGSDYRFDEITLGEGEIFFLGDNRAVSQDAQELAAAGCPMFREEDILGVVPSWAVAVKQISTGWESIRGFFSSLFNPNI